MKDRVLTEEVFDEIVEKMNKDFERGLDWNSFHPAVAPWTARKLEKEFPNNCPFCGLSWEKCQEWRNK